MPIDEFHNGSMWDQLEMLGEDSQLRRINLLARDRSYWESIPAPDLSSLEQAFPELEPFRVLREAGLQHVEHR